MTRRQAIWAWILLFAAVFAAVVVMAPRVAATSSTLSAGSGGWLAARRYLEVEGVRVTLHDLPLDRASEVDAAPDGAWILAFPWQKTLGDEELEALRGHLRDGGTLLLAYSRTLEQAQEQTVLQELGLTRDAIRPPPPLRPWAWWSYTRETWTLDRADGWGDAAAVHELMLPAPRYAPVAPDGALVYYVRRSADRDVPMVFSYEHYGGRVIAMPADVFSNAYLFAAGHADFLASLRQSLGDAWIFDEYHHGLVDAELAAAESGADLAWNLFMIHLGVFYLLALLATARRFGPPWRESAVAAGSTSSFLRNLGGLHRSLGHHPAAARLLVERQRELEASRPAAGVPDIRIPEIHSDAQLVDFARRASQPSRRPVR